MCLVDTRARACIVQGMSHLETRPDNMLVTVDCGVPLVMREGRIRERRGEERRRERWPKEGRKEGRKEYMLHSLALLWPT